MKEAIQKLFEGTEVSQEFKDSVTAIIESEVETRATQIAEELETKYEAASVEHKQYVEEQLKEAADQYIQTEVVPMVEKYLDYSVNEFVKENTIAIESGIKVELAESFLSGLSGLAEQYNVQVPAGQDDVIAEMQAKLDKAEQRLDSLINEKNQLQEQLNKEVMSKIVDGKTVDLTESQREKFFGVVAKVDFINEEQYTKAVDELYEAYFPVETAKSEQVNESLNESVEVKVEKTEDKWLTALFSKI